MPQLRARADDLCELCGEPIDFEAPARSSRRPSVDHVVPLHAGGDPLPPVDELRLAHHGCNSRRGNRTRRRVGVRPVAPAVELRPALEPRPVAYIPHVRSHKRAEPPSSQASLFTELDLDREKNNSEKNSGEKISENEKNNFAKKISREFFSDEATRRQSRAIISPRNSRIATDSVELVAPRLETPRPSDVVGSYGAEAAGWIARYLRDELRPWQRYALERVLEHREDGSLRWRRVILTVSRQSGKSILSRGLCGWRVGAADLFGEPQHVLHVANLRATAQKIWTPAARTLEESLGAIVRRSNGQEAIELADGSRWELAASNLDGGVGGSYSEAFVDEAWRVSRDVVDGSIAPTMLERSSPQLILVSTAGDGGSLLLLEDRDAAIAQLAEPDSARILLLEWSAPPEAYVDDRDAWRLASPHWTPARLEALEHAFATSSESDWRRQYLNQWVLAARSWIAPAQWAEATELELELPRAPAGTVAINDQDGNPGSCGYVAAVLDGERVLVSGRAFPSRRALWAALEDLGRTRRGAELLYPASFEKHVARLPGFLPVKVGTAEQRAGYGPTLGAVVDGRLRHDGGDELTRQMLTATPVTIPDVGTSLSARRSPGPIYLARAAVWAIGAELRPEQRPRAMVVG
jgi:hypothetical protein